MKGKSIGQIIRKPYGLIKTEGKKRNKFHEVFINPPIWGRKNAKSPNHYYYRIK